MIKAVVCFLVKDNQILLGVREKVSNDLGQDLISGIGGKFEENETAEETLVREVEEEIGVVATEYENMGRAKFMFPHKPKWNQDVIIFIVTKWKGEPHKVIPDDPDAGIINPKWFNVDEIPYDKMWDDNSYWLPQVLKGEKIKAEFVFDENSKVEKHKVVLL